MSVEGVLIETRTDSPRGTGKPNAVTNANIFGTFEPSLIFSTYTCPGSVLIAMTFPAGMGVLYSMAAAPICTTKLGSGPMADIAGYIGPWLVLLRQASPVKAWLGDV